MPLLTDQREYRNLAILQPTQNNKRIDTDYYVEGYATTFNDPYLLIDCGEFKLYEQIDRDSLVDADLSDLKFQINHKGTVYARQKQGTLGMETDQKGIFIYADLSKTTRSKQIYEEIEAGYIDQMSWAFTVLEDSLEWNNDLTECLRTIKKVKKVYEFSGVTEPANPNTSLEAKSMKENKVNTGEIHIISARSLLDGVIESRKQELLKRSEREIQKRKLKLKLEVLQ